MAQEIITETRAALSERLEQLPAERVGTAEAKLGIAVIQALDRLAEITAVEITPSMLIHEPKTARLIADTALGVVKLGLRAREGEVERRHKESQLRALLAALREPPTNT